MLKSEKSFLALELRKTLSLCFSRFDRIMVKTLMKQFFLVFIAYLFIGEMCNLVCVQQWLFKRERKKKHG